MKKLLLATTAFVVLAVGSATAADLRPAYKAAPPPPPIYSWTGLYWGVNVGYSWGRAKDEVSLLGVGTFSESRRSTASSAASSRATTISSANGCSALKPTSKPRARRAARAPGLRASASRLTTDHKLTWFGTSRTRLGVLGSPNVLLYGTAGVAYGQVKDTATLTAPGASVTGTFKDVRAGWTAGAGVEGVIGGGWTAKLEYLYIDLGKTEQTLATPALGQVNSETRRFTDNIVRVGFNYRWGGGAY